MPVGQFSGTRNRGYDGVHPYAPQHSYGGPHGLQRLVNACHMHGPPSFSTLSATISGRKTATWENTGRTSQTITAPHGERPGGFGIDAQWSDDFHHLMHVALTGERQGYYEDYGAPELL